MVIQAYPIHIRLSATALQELVDSECASFEDGEGMSGRKSESHVHAVAKRHRSFLEIRDSAEAEDAYYAVSSGTFQLSYLAAARKIANALAPYVPDGLRSTWYPSGM